MTIIKTISLHQPYASLLASGAKRIESRDWRPASLRPGQLVAIHAAKKWPPDYWDEMRDEPFFKRHLTLAVRRRLWSWSEPPAQYLGGVVAIARFLGAFPTERLIHHITETERAFGHYAPGRYGWVFSEVRPLAIIPARGQQGLFDWEPLPSDGMQALYIEQVNRPRSGSRMAALLEELRESLRYPTAPPPEATAPTPVQPTRVVHCRREAYDLYVGRAVKRYPDLRPLGWGNPYSEGLDTPEGRQSAIDRYRAWILDQPKLLARLPELRGRVLGCWCALLGGLPGDLYGHTCHGEVLAALADRWCAHCHQIESPEHVRDHDLVERGR